MNADVIRAFVLGLNLRELDSLIQVPVSRDSYNRCELFDRKVKGRLGLNSNKLVILKHTLFRLLVLYFKVWWGFVTVNVFNDSFALQGALFYHF